LFADSVSASRTSILVGELAKLLRQNGVEVGQNRLFEILREDGFLVKGGSSRNMPTQRSMELGLFEIKETTINRSDGGIDVKKTPKVTGRGQVYFLNRFCID
jgi:anti-repressor protein